MTLSPSVSERYEAWNAPFLADPRDETANAERSRQTRELAAAILAAPLGTRAGPLTINSGGWSKEAADQADAAGEPGSPEWRAALGLHEHAVLTSDGRAAIRNAWCSCPFGQDSGSWVRYEAWAAVGCDRHGFVCRECRKLVQTG